MTKVNQIGYCLIICLFCSCISQKKYTAATHRINELRKDSTRLSEVISKKSATEKSLIAELSKKNQHFDTTVNSIIKTADKRVVLMNKQYIEKMATQLEKLKNEVSNKYKAVFKHQIAQGLMSVENSTGKLILRLNMDKLYDHNNFEFNQKGQEIIRELSTDENIRKYYVYATNTFTYLNVKGQQIEALANSSAFMDLLQQTEAAQISSSKAENLPDTLQQYVAQRVDLSFQFGYENLEQPFFNVTAQGGQLVTLRNQMPAGVDSMVTSSAGYSLASLSYGDNKNIKYMINPSDFLMGRFAQSNPNEVIRKIQTLYNKPHTRVIRVEGFDRTEKICYERKAVIIVSMNNKLIKLYPVRQMKCENDVIDLNR